MTLAPGAAPGATAQTAGRGSCSLYVGDLPTDLPNPEDALFNLFSKIGMVMSIKVCRDINTQRSLGYAYVNFQNPTDAEQALNRLNFSEIRPGRPIRVMWSVRDPALRKSGNGNLFVKNLDLGLDHRALHDTFSVFGNIYSCKIATDETGKSLGYGFVHFETEESAKAAIAQLNGTAIAPNGKPIEVVPFIKKQERDEQEEKIFRNVYVKNLKNSATEEDVRKELGGFGAIESVFVGAGQKFQTKFALVVFTDHEAATKVIDQLHDKPSPLSEADQKLYVARALKKRDRQAQRSRASANNLYQSQGRNVYVKHLDDAMTEQSFRDLFSQFGEITSAKLMQDESGHLRGFGFVCFTTKDAASAAVREMNGKMIGRRPLYVSQAQQRDMRHHMLDEQRKALLQQQQRMAMTIQPFWNDGGRGMGPMGRGGPFGGRGGGAPPMPMPGFGFPPGPFGGPMGMPPNRNPQMRGMRPPPVMMPPQQFGMVPPMGGAPHRGYTQPPNMRGAPPMAATQIGGIGLTSAELSKLPPEEQKNALGEKLYVKIQELNPTQAPKITGMLLEMDIPEILNVLEDKNMLAMKVREAEGVLSRHEKH